MDKKNLIPMAAQPVNRTIAGQLPAELTELSEEALQLYGEGDRSSTSVLPSYICTSPHGPVCSYDGDDAE
jgi:bacteriocin leader peptide (microcyclamide/patellamide family)